MKKAAFHLPELRGEKVTSEKPTLSQVWVPKSLYLSGPGTSSQEASLRRGMVPRKPVGSAETQNFPRRTSLPPDSQKK